MKSLRESIGLFARLGTAAAVLLLALPQQQALAAGTTAGTDVDNLAIVNYEVGGNPQALIESSPTGNSTPGATNGTDTTFVVDNRVDFTLAQVGAAHTQVAPGDTDEVIEFTLTNEGNSTMDFRLDFSHLGSGDGAVNGETDTDVDISNVRIRVGNGGGAPVLGDLAFVDEIAEDATVTIYIFADAQGTLVDDDISNIEIEATAATAGGGGVLGADLVDDAGNADDPAAVDIVFAEDIVAPGLGDGVLTARDGYEVISAALEITKVATVIWDPFNEAVAPKAIPGATVEYVITVDNTGAEDATSIAITDAIDTDVNVLLAQFAGEDMEIDNDSTVTTCTLDAAPSDGDGCELNGQDITVDGAASATVDAGTTMTITYQVTIP